MLFADFPVSQQDVNHSSSRLVEILSAETISIEANAENSEGEKVCSNNQESYTTSYSQFGILVDIIEINKVIFSALTEVLQKTLLLWARNFQNVK